MKKYLWFIIFGIALAVLSIFLILFFIIQSLSTTLEITIHDAVSKSNPTG